MPTKKSVVAQATQAISNLISPLSEGFKEKVTPKKLDENEVFFFKCTKCGGIHFRHAGYVELMTPFLTADGKSDQKKVVMDSYLVKVCVKCKSAFVWLNNQMYDISDRIDLKAWEKTEKVAHKATGPGGQC